MFNSIFGKIQALTEVYSKECMSRTCVFKWHKKFREGRTDVEDDERSRRPAVSKTTTISEKLKKLS